MKLDAVAWNGNGKWDRRGVWEETKWEERTYHTKVLHLVCKYHSPNQEWKLSAGELNKWENETRDILTTVPLRGAAVFNYANTMELCTIEGVG